MHSRFKNARPPSRVHRSKARRRFEGVIRRWTMSRAGHAQAKSRPPSLSLKCWCLIPEARPWGQRPRVDDRGVLADVFNGRVRSDRTMRSPRTTNACSGVTLRSRESNNCALRITSSPRGVWGEREKQCASTTRLGFFWLLFAQQNRADRRVGNHPARPETTTTQIADAPIVI